MMDGKVVTREEFATAVKKRIGCPCIQVPWPVLHTRVDADLMEVLPASGKG